MEDCRSPRYANLREFSPSDEQVDEFVKAASTNSISKLDRILKANRTIIDMSSQPRGETALHFATWYGKIDTVQWLLDNGANVNSLDRYGYSPLCWAAWRGFPDIAEMLIQYGALEAWKKLKNQKLENGRMAQSPMLCVILRKKEKIMKLFLDAEIEDVMQLSTDDSCMLLRAASGNFFEGVQLMFEYGFDDLGLGTYGDDLKEEHRVQNQQVIAQAHDNQTQQQNLQENQPQEDQNAHQEQHQQPDDEMKLDIHRENFLQFQRLVEQNQKLAEAIRNGIQANRKPKMSLLALAMKFDPQCSLSRLAKHPDYDQNITKEFLKFMSCQILKQL